MKVSSTSLHEALLLEPSLYHDERGFFFESFQYERISQILKQSYSFVQDNQSTSKKGVLRGLHYQVKQVQGKLIRVLKGEIFDVIVDLRKESPTFLSWEGFYLTAENYHQLWVPPGFAHGFLSLSEEATVLYKTTDYYAPHYERTLLWNEPTLGIQWPVLDKNYLISEKDQLGLSLEQAIKELSLC